MILLFGKLILQSIGSATSAAWYVTAEHSEHDVTKEGYLSKELISFEEHSGDLLIETFCPRRFECSICLDEIAFQFEPHLVHPNGKCLAINNLIIKQTEEA